MMKRLLCPALIAAMLMSSLLLFAGCSEGDPNIEAEANRGTKTLVLCIQTKDNTTEESVRLVEAEINKITKSKFKTKVVLKAYKEEDYYAAIEQSFTEKENEAAMADKAAKELRKYLKDFTDKNEGRRKFYEEFPEYAKYAETTTDIFAESTAEETIFNEDTGFLELKYPEHDPNAVDIFFIGGYERLLEYIENDWVSRLDDELSSGSKKLKYYISPAYLSSVKVDKSTYAIPNNRTIGEYTYMLVNKELIKKYYYNINDLRDLPGCEEFLADIAKHEPNVIPIDGAPDIYNVLYWSINADTLAIERDNFSVVGRTYNARSTYGEPPLFTSLFTFSSYRGQLLANKLYEELGYFRSNVSSDAECAIKIVKGGAELEDLYAEKYEMVMLESPRAYIDDVFSSMFAIGGYVDSSTLARAMEILTYLNTNADLRNLLAYGIEGINYTLDEAGQVVRTPNNGYHMDLYKTGNAFIAHTEKGMDPEIWENGKKQNRDVTIDMLFDFTFVGEKVDVAPIKAIAALSDAIKARIDACTTYRELDDLLKLLTEELRSNSDIRLFTNSQAEENAAGERPPYVIFYEWLNLKGFISAE